MNKYFCEIRTHVICPSFRSYFRPEESERGVEGRQWTLPSAELKYIEVMMGNVMIMLSLLPT
jgi:hypothetical protein